MGYYPLEFFGLVEPETLGQPTFLRLVLRSSLREHKVYEELDLPQGIRPLSIRWVDRDDYHTVKSRLTARGYEQELTGQENDVAIRKQC